MFRTIFSLLAKDTVGVRDEQHWQSMNAQAVPPRNDALPRRCWIVPAQSQSEVWPGMFWSTSARQTPSAAPVPYDYVGVARDANGAPIMVQPNDPVLMTTYPGSANICIKAIQQYSYIFGGLGVPYLVRKQITDDLSGYNFSNKLPAIDYPVDPLSDLLWISGGLARALAAKEGLPNPGPEDVFAIHYQDFIRVCRPPAARTARERLTLVDQTRASKLSDDDQVQAIRAAVTDYGTSAA